MIKNKKILLVITAILTLLFSTGAKPGAATTTVSPAKNNPAPTNMSGIISVSPNQALGEGFVNVSYTQSKTMGFIRVFSIDQNTLLTRPGDDTIYSNNNGTSLFIAPADVGRYTFRLCDPDTREVVAESNVLEIIEFTPSLVVEKPTYTTGEMVNVSLRDGSGLNGAELYMIYSDTGAEVPETRMDEPTGRGNMGWVAPGPGKYQIVHTRDTKGKIIARSNIFTVEANTTTSPPTTTNPGTVANPTTVPNPANPATTPAANDTVDGAPVSGQQNTIILRIGSPFMTVNGVIEKVDSASDRTTPVIVKNRTLLPIRSVIEALGGTVAWDGKAQKVTVKLKGKTVELWLNKKTVKVNGSAKTIDVTPQTMNGRTMLPVRFITENLGCSVSWDDKTKQVTVSSK